MSDFKLFSCYRPKKIYNNSLGRFIQVGCGSCPACLMKRSSHNSMLCSLEESSFSYCAFVTLTYSNDFVPLMRAEKRLIAHEYYDEFLKKHRVIDTFVYDFYDTTERFSSKENIFGRFLFSHVVDDFSLLQLARKVVPGSSSVDIDNLPDFPYLSKYDVTCFLKRFRKLLTKYSYEKIRYYVVGEYGPVHFRPHFHLLLFFNSKEVFQNYRKCIRLAWSKRTRCYNKRSKKFYYKSVPFGRVDASLSRGNCSSYVAKYVNSFTSLPRLYKYNSVCPFSSHSRFFGQSIYQSQKKEIYENEPSFFVKQITECCSKPFVLRPWRSVISVFFPKVRNYAQKSFDGLLYSYRLLQTARHFYKFTSIRELSKLVLQDIFKYGSIHFAHEHPLSYRSKFFFISFIMNDLSISPNSFIEDDKLFVRLDSLFYISNHFLNFVCDNHSYIEICNKVKIINNFYSYLDYSNLTAALSAQDDYVSVDGSSILPFFYDNNTIDYDNFNFHSLKSYVDFVSSTDARFSKSVKHKYLNDLNNIFLNI